MDNTQISDLDASDFDFGGIAISKPLAAEQIAVSPAWTAEQHLWYAGVNDKYLHQMDVDFFEMA